MLYKSKLKGSFGRIYPISIIIVYILCLLELFIRWNLIEQSYLVGKFPVLSFLIAGLFFVTMGIIQYNRYRIWIYPVLGFFAGLGCILAIYLIPGSEPVFKMVYFANMLVIILLVIIFWPVLSGQERYESNARRLFKLASEHINETSNGFTERPFAAGDISLDRDTLMGFARFVNGKYIARSFYINDIIYLTFSLNKSVLKVNQPNEVSYVSINFDGKVNVQILQDDYRQYKANFNFDKLCESMGNVMKRFVEYYQKGNEGRIITELKTVR